MSEHDANLAYRAIISWLRENNLDWIAIQIEDEVVLGKTSYGSISSSKQLATDQSKPLKKRSERVSGEFVAREDYTSEEKFEIAIGAVDAVIVGATKIEEFLSKALSVEGTDPTITFASDGQTRSYGRIDLTARRERADELSGLLGELRKAVAELMPTCFQK